MVVFFLDFKGSEEEYFFFLVIIQIEKFPGKIKHFSMAVSISCILIFKQKRY